MHLVLNVYPITRKTRLFKCCRIMHILSEKNYTCIVGFFLQIENLACFLSKANKNDILNCVYIKIPDQTYWFILLETSISEVRTQLAQIIHFYTQQRDSIIIFCIPRYYTMHYSHKEYLQINTTCEESAPNTCAPGKISTHRRKNSITINLYEHMSNIIERLNCALYFVFIVV